MATAAAGDVGGVPGAVDDVGLVVRLSTIPLAGRGLFTTRAFPAGSVVCVYTGEVLKTAVAIALPDKAYLMRLGPQTYINATEAEHGHVLARYINDCRNDALLNVTFVKLPEERCAHVVALRDIAAGEELFVSYGRWYWLKEPGQRLPTPPKARDSQPVASGVELLAPDGDTVSA
jgi:hypothetical protein